MWRPLRLTEALECEKYGFGVLDAHVQVDNHVVFKTIAATPYSQPVYGRVHAIDLTATYPLVIEWYDGVNNKRLTRFRPTDFLYIETTETLHDAKSRAWH